MPILKIHNKKELYDTWDNWCLRKLKEIGKSTMKQWAEAMGYKVPQNMQRPVRNLEKEGKLIIEAIRYTRRFTYEVKDDIVFKNNRSK